MVSDALTPSLPSVIRYSGIAQTMRWDVKPTVSQSSGPEGLPFTGCWGDMIRGPQPLLAAISVAQALLKREQVLTLLVWVLTLRPPYKVSSRESRSLLPKTSTPLVYPTSRPFLPAPSFHFSHRLCPGLQRIFLTPDHTSGINPLVSWKTTWSGGAAFF